MLDPSTDANTVRWLDAFGALYGKLQRKLYALIAKGENASALKVEFSAEFGLSARQFNAMRIELQGKIVSTVELLKLRKKELQGGIGSIKRSIKKIEKALDDLEKEQRGGKPDVPTPRLLAAAAKRAKREETLRRQVFNKKRRLTSLTEKLKRVDARLKAPVPGICFGSRKLFNQQFHLAQAEFGTGEKGFANWKKAWRAARSHQFFLIGSKDETAGNQSCKAVVCHAAPTPDAAGPSTLILSIKMPPTLVKQGAPAFLRIQNISFEYGQESVNRALGAGTALTYRFHRDKLGWRVLVATDVGDAAQKSLSKEFGVLGVDFNADHLAWSRTDRFGNPIEFGRIDLALHGKTAGQREAILSGALDDVFAKAKQHACCVSIEDLDFAAKKKELRKLGERRARMLSGLAYAQFRQLAQGKASRLGIELQIIDPAYTSVAGSIKYAVRHGRTIHQAAAGVIARRAQGYSEKLPRRHARAPLMGHTADLTLPVRNRRETPRMSWAFIRKCLAQHCAEQVRARKRSSSCRSKGQPEPSASVSLHPLESGSNTPSSREPGILLARRPNHFPDVPY